MTAGYLFVLIYWFNQHITKVLLLEDQSTLSTLLNSCSAIESTLKINVKQKFTIIKPGMQINSYQQTIYCFIKFYEFTYLEVTWRFKKCH